MTRRSFGALALGAAAQPVIAAANPPTTIICAPSSLGLRPGERGVEPGAWRAPETLVRHGLPGRLGAAVDSSLAHPAYFSGPQPGSRILNGPQIRRFSDELAGRVSSVLRTGGVPVVLGGDCSILLGCLYGSALQGGRGLVHVDGHSDYFHPGNYDPASRLGTAAGMDLALATGKGEPLLAKWPGKGRLVDEADAFQIGERDSERPEFRTSYGDIVRSGITQVTVQAVLRDGMELTADRIVSRLKARRLSRAWLHVDFDVLDQSVLPAVDSPGSPGLDHEQLAILLRRLLRTGRFCGVDFTIYDPDLDAGEQAAPHLVDCIVAGLTGSGMTA